MIGRIREALARGEQPQASGPNVDGGFHYRTQMDYSKMFDHRIVVNNSFDGKIKAGEWVKKTRNFFLGSCQPTEWTLEWVEKRNAEIRPIKPGDLLRLRMRKGRRRTFSASRKRFGRSSTAVCHAKAR